MHEWEGNISPYCPTIASTIIYYYMTIIKAWDNTEILSKKIRNKKANISHYNYG